jgi:hypothetical protein
MNIYPLSIWCVAPDIAAALKIIKSLKRTGFWHPLSIYISGLYCSYIYINLTNIIQIQDKLIINYVIQTKCQTNIISKFKIFLNNQD